jgi:hypothetical protein
MMALLIYLKCANTAQLDLFGARSFLFQFYKHLSLQDNLILASLLPFARSMAKEIIRFNWDRTSLLPYEPDILASQQYLKSYRRAKSAEPEKALMFAVLVQAVETYQRFAFSESPRGQALFHEVKAWFWSEEVDGIFSFRSICDVSGLNPEFLRRGLMQWTASRQCSASPRKRIQFRSVRSRSRKRTISFQDIPGATR